MNPRMFLIAAVTLNLSGCGGDGSPRSSAVVRDSAGIRIVENSDPSWRGETAWRLAEAPSLTIGSLDGDPIYQLFGVRNAVRLDDGRIVIANGGSYELRFYGADGAFLVSTGRQGGGPGEFENLRWVRRMGPDSLLAYDSRARRMSVFDFEGTFARAFTIRGNDEIRFPSPSGMFRDGTLLVEGGTAATTNSPSGLSRSDVTLFRFTADGEAGDSLGSVPGNESYIEADGQGVRVAGALFGRSTRFLVSPDAFVVATNDSYELKRFDPTGRLTMIIRRAHVQHPVTPDDHEALIQQQVEAIPENFRAGFEPLFRKMPIPETMPAFANVLSDDLGDIWVLEYNRPGDDQPRWTVFDPEGRMLGTVEFPIGFTPHHIGGDFVLGKWQDEFDVEYVQRYELLKST